MSFLNFQKPYWKDGYRLGQQSDDEGSEYCGTSVTRLPECRPYIPRMFLFYATLATCYSILVTVILTTHVLGAKYSGPSVIYSKFCQ